MPPTTGITIENTVLGTEATKSIPASFNPAIVADATS
jgi:hypothetical protein